MPIGASTRLLRRVVLHVNEARGSDAPQHDGHVRDAAHVACRNALPPSVWPLALLAALPASWSLLPRGPVTGPGARPPGRREITRVLVISVDGLNPDAITQLGAAGHPDFHAMMSKGAWTFNARTEVEQTVTLPNHTSMLTGRRIDRTPAGTA